jgi:hypothetical protein
MRLAYVTLEHGELWSMSKRERDVLTAAMRAHIETLARERGLIDDSMLILQALEAGRQQ